MKEAIFEFVSPTETKMRDLFSALHYNTLYYALPVHTSFDDLDPFQLQGNWSLKMNKKLHFNMFRLRAWTLHINYYVLYLGDFFIAAFVFITAFVFLKDRTPVLFCLQFFFFSETKTRTRKENAAQPQDQPKFTLGGWPEMSTKSTSKKSLRCMVPSST